MRQEHRHVKLTNTSQIAWQHTGFPRGTESSEKILNLKTGFQDLGKVLKLAKICIKY